jgi:hypothetical protein
MVVVTPVAAAIVIVPAAAVVPVPSRPSCIAVAATRRSARAGRWWQGDAGGFQRSTPLPIFSAVPYELLLRRVGPFAVPSIPVDGVTDGISILLQLFIELLLLQPIQLLLLLASKLGVGRAPLRLDSGPSDRDA